VIGVETESSFGSTSGYLRVADIASGGMGRVDLCLRKHGAFQRLYAVKRLHPHYREDEDMRTMFLDEARVAGLLRHANIVSVLDVGEDDDGPFLVMDYVEGVSLSEFIRHHASEQEPIPASLCGSIVSQIARGLHAAHELVGADGEPLALVHRDVSPQNVLVGRDGLVRVTDFGISKALGRSSQTSTGLLKGKVGYMSPEQLRFEVVDRRSDLFALGIVLYELVTCRRLYKGPDSNLVARRILGEPAPDIGDQRPEIPASAVALCFRLLAKRPEDRPETAAEVADALDEAFALDESVDLGAYIESRFGDRLASRRAEVQDSLSKVAREAASTEVSAATTETPKRRRWPIVAGLGLGTVAVAGVMMAMSNTTPESPAVPEAAQAQTPPAAMPEPDASATVHLRVESRPEGAEVRLGSEVLGTTPVVAEIPRDVETEIDVVKDGFESQRHVIAGRADERIVVALSPVAEDVEPEVSVETAPPPRKRRKRSRPRKRTSKPDTAEPKSSSPFRRFE